MSIASMSRLESPFVEGPEATIAVRFHDVLIRFLRPHSAASHVSRKVACFVRESSHRPQIVVDSRSRGSREESQLRPDPTIFLLGAAELSDDNLSTGRRPFAPRRGRGEFGEIVKWAP